MAGHGLGDCVDCNLCVAVCPTGIDIRDGQQLECISCALCVDACNSVMGKVGLPQGLITYDTERRQDSRAAGRPLVYRLVRPRTLLYGLVFVVIATLMIWQLITRATLDLNVLHDRNPLFVTLADGSIRNGYTVKLLNMNREARDFTLEVVGLEAAKMQVVGREGDSFARLNLGAQADGVATYTIYVRMPRSEMTQETLSFEFLLREVLSGDSARHETVFRGPGS